VLSKATCPVSPAQPVEENTKLEPSSRFNEHAAAWLRLLGTPGIGPVTARQLATACGGVCEIWKKTADELSGIEGVGRKAVQAIAGTGPDAAMSIMQQCAELGIDTLCLDDEAYPAALRQCDDAPPVLFARGQLPSLDHIRLLAVVGARKADSEARLLTRRWSRALAMQGVGIVSGMAYGIDAAAHGGALEAGNAPTIAVLGCGLAAPLSPVQQKQIAAIGENGCVLSEFLPQEEARPEHFPKRNRIIAGMTAATLVVQADLRSGSLITARLAAGYGREVLAVPGSVLAGRHAGCHQLLRDGASLAESPEDILRLMHWQGGEKSAHPDYAPASAQEAAILQALGDEIMHIDALAEHCALTVPELSPILLGLELIGVVESLPGSRYTLGHGD